MGTANFTLDLDHHLTELNEGFGSFSLNVNDFQIEDLEVAGFPLIPLQFFRNNHRDGTTETN